VNLKSEKDKSNNLGKELFPNLEELFLSFWKRSKYQESALGK
jgi:hypothetical protein